MTVRGSEAEDVDVSTVTAFPTNPQIDLTTGITMTASAWVFTNLDATVHIFVTDDPAKGEIRLLPGIPLGIDSASRRWWVRAQATGTNVKLSWGAT